MTEKDTTKERDAILRTIETYEQYHPTLAYKGTNGIAIGITYTPTDGDGKSRFVTFPRNWFGAQTAAIKEHNTIVTEGTKDLSIVTQSSMVDVKGENISLELQGNDYNNDVSIGGFGADSKTKNITINASFGNVGKVYSVGRADTVNIKAGSGNDRVIIYPVATNISVDGGRGEDLLMIALDSISPHASVTYDIMRSKTDQTLAIRRGSNTMVAMKDVEGVYFICVGDQKVRLNAQKLADAMDGLSLSNIELTLDPSSCTISGSPVLKLRDVDVSANGR